MTEMYARKEKDGFYTLRQSRYRAQLGAGKEHPHDVCAVARNPQELLDMCGKHWPLADYSALGVTPETPRSGKYPYGPILTD